MPALAEMPAGVAERKPEVDTGEEKGHLYIFWGFGVEMRHGHCWRCASRDEFKWCPITLV